MPRARARSPETQARRDAVLDAALEIIGEHGLPAATHRAIAQRAGVPLASTNYFFGSIDDLIEAAFRRWVVRRTNQFEAIAAAGIDAHATPKELLDALVTNLLDAPRATELAQYEAYLYAARAPALRQAVDDCIAAFTRAAEAALRAAGAPDPGGSAGAFVALCDGFLLAQLAVPREDAAERLRAALRALLITALMDTEEHTKRMKRIELGGT